MNRKQAQRSVSGLLLLSGLASVAACGNDSASDGVVALASFREFVASAFTEERQKPFSWLRETTCKFRTDVRATHAVAEPYEGLLHIDVTWIRDEPNDSRPSRVSGADLVFDRVGQTWTCSETKSTLAAKSWSEVSPEGVCATVDRTCRRASKVEPVKKPDRQRVSLYPEDWKDLLPYGEAHIFDHASSSWRCSDSVQSKTGKRLDRIDGRGTASLTFVPAKETTFEEDLRALELTWQRKPDKLASGNDEGGKTRSACWLTASSVTSLRSGAVLAKGTIVTVMARDADSCGDR